MKSEIIKKNENGCNKIWNLTSLKKYRKVLIKYEIIKKIQNGYNKIWNLKLKKIKVVIINYEIWNH